MPFRPSARSPMISPTAWRDEMIARGESGIEFLRDALSPRAMQRYSSAPSLCFGVQN